jgi:RNA polymerase sigma-70 factor, ECF subfamily
MATPSAHALAGCRPRPSGLRLPALSRLPRFEFDGSYVDRLVGEDPEIERHFTRYFGNLLSLKLRSKLRSPALVEDAKQETFVRVLTAIKKGRGLVTPESLGAFVNSVANNVVFELYRSGTRVTALPEDHDEPDLREEGAETGLMAEEERRQVREALAGLPQKEKDLLRWVFFEGRDKDEVCRDLNVDRNYLRVLLHRAKNRFRDRYVGEETH